ncbi:hypothetical protein HELRODRAFT_171781 [Helobdella robusta]|uniref:Uncharacterized protein n=1 Tax=Helobdella robusta TaxID=6412 RepID=T1F4N9_HELRO|nr:hypothetical protein HELRODRAFT_171781 [Helobdella robusta]ESO05390.1 hypothetical protein HELRODRAFT_171781 [Helobdella robusta]
MVSSAENSLVCASSSNLLTQLFAISPPAPLSSTSILSSSSSSSSSSWDVVHPITFPSNECQSSKIMCESSQQCCHIDCLSSTHCKHFYSSECTDAQIECAMGNVFRYTIEPKFLRVDDHYRCHLKKKLLRKFIKPVAFETASRTGSNMQKYVGSCYLNRNKVLIGGCHT